MCAKKMSQLSEREKKRAMEIYQKSIVIDCLSVAPTLKHPEYLREIRDVGVTATHFTVYMPHEHLLEALEGIAGWYEMAEQNDTIIALKADDIIRAKEENRFCAIMGTQNAKTIGDNIRIIRVFHALGIRIMQLAYDEQNYIGSGGDEEDCGITKFGRKVIEEMNRMGMLIDVSHCGEKTVMDTIKYSQAPIAFTHANPRAKVDHYRCKTDEQIIALAEKGGVIGVTAWSRTAMVKKGTRPDIEDFLDLMEYVIDLVGVDHVGFGTDLTPNWDWEHDEYSEFVERYPGLNTVDGKAIDREERTVDGLHHVSKIENIAKGLVARGYSEDDIQKILGGNFLNLLGKVWKN
jgi:membrane dipeptidase